MEHPVPLTVHQVGTQQHDVAGLGVGKNLTPEQVGIGILQSAGQGQEHSREKGLGHLSVMISLQFQHLLFALYYSLFWGGG